MLLRSWLKLWFNTPLFTDLAAGIKSSSFYRAAVQGVDPGAGGFIMAGLAEYCRRPTLIITADVTRAERIYEDLLAFFPRSHVHLLLSRELFMTGDLLTQSAERLQRRLHFLNWAGTGEQGIYIAPLGAILSRAVPPEYWGSLALEIRPGLPMDRDYLVNRLAEMGYQRASMIEAKGQFSVRGEIIDIFPPEQERPVRVEMFEDTIGATRSFDCQTQRSTGDLSGIDVNPAFELILPPVNFGRGKSLCAGKSDWRWKNW